MPVSEWHEPEPPAGLLLGAGGWSFLLVPAKYLPAICCVPVRNFPASLEPVDQVCNRCFSGTGTSNESDLLSWSGKKVYVVQNHFVRIVSKIDTALVADRYADL